MTRRILALYLILLAVVPAFAQTGIDVPSMLKADTLITEFMKSWSITGGTVAITKDGRLIYNRGFGYADQAKTEPMQPYHLQRIASNSKAITAIAIMKLIQDAKLKLDDTVFGSTRILTSSYYLSAITDSRVYNMTVKQLLEHTAGWDRGIACDGYSHCDPISFPLHVTSVMSEGNPVGDSTLIKFLLSKSLNHTPGTTYAYSNIGYLVLAKVIEKVTGMKYEDYVASVIMDPLGLKDMHLGKNLLADKQEREGEYNSTSTTLSCYGTGSTVPWQYGGWNLEAMHAHGGWISTSEDYVRMILAVDGKSTVADILSPASITTMTTPSSANAYYAKGWSVNTAGNWWHTGSLDGTSSFMCRTSGGYTWAIHFNARSSASTFWSELDDLPWDCLAATSSFPTHDLFAPLTQASGLTASKTDATTVHLTWTAGSGDNRTVLATESSSWKSFPLEGVSYTGNSAYGLGPALGNSTYVVYSGGGASVDVTGLDPSKTYLFTVLEGSNNTVTGSKAVYKYGGRSNAKVNMAATSVSAGNSRGLVAIYPNPANSQVTLVHSDAGLRGTEARLTDLQGRIIIRFVIAQEKQPIDISALSPGLYYFRLKNGVSLKLMKM